MNVVTIRPNLIAVLQSYALKVRPKVPPPRSHLLFTNYELRITNCDPRTPNPELPMRDVIIHLNYVHVLVVAVAGFILGCLWLHGPLFGKPWMAEMKMTKESMEAAMKEQGMTKVFLKGFTFTLLSTFGLAVLIAVHGSSNWKHGAAFGLFVGVFGSGMRLLDFAVWENKSVKLQAINFGHEVVVYALQGAILGAWH